MSEFDLNSDPAKLPALPSLDGVSDPTVKKFLQAVKEQIEIRNGQRPRTNKLDQALTFRDLYDYGLASFKINGKEVSNSNPSGAVNLTGTGGNTNTGDDLTIPGAPIGLIATGTKLSILLEWDAASTSIAYTEVWRSPTNDLATAVLIGSTPATIYADILNEAGVTFYYWIRFVNTGGIAGAYNDDVGTIATTGQIGSAEILSIDGAKIIDATILNAKISSVSADKITTGVLNATQAISIGNSTSRVHITGDGRIRSGGALDFMNGSGWYFDNPDGLGRMFVGNGTYYIAWNGSIPLIQAPNFSLTPNSLTFNGSGTFTGAVTGATINGGTLNINNQFMVDESGNMTALSGTYGGTLLAGVLDFSQLDGFRQNFTVPGTYQFTVPADKTKLRISVAGGSGGGGNGGRGINWGFWPNTQASGGGGGGAGGGVNPSVNTVDVTPGQTYTIVVGAGGGIAQSGQQSYISGLPIIGTITSQGGGAGQNGGDPPGNNTVGRGGAAGLNVNGANSSPGNDGNFQYGNSGTSAGGFGGVGGGLVRGGNGGKGGDGVGSNGTYNGQSGSPGQNGYVLIEAFNPNAVVLQTTYNTLISALQRQAIQTT